MLGKEIEETPSWGLDLYTKKNIFYLLPESLPDATKNEFIMNSLMKAINLQRENGWNIKASCDSIIANSLSKQQRLTTTTAENAKEGKEVVLLYDSTSRKCAKALLHAIVFIEKIFINCSMEEGGGETEK